MMYNANLCNYDNNKDQNMLKYDSKNERKSKIPKTSVITVTVY